MGNITNKYKSVPPSYHELYSDSSSLPSYEELYRNNSNPKPPSYDDIDKKNKTVNSKAEFIELVNNIVSDNNCLPIDYDLIIIKIKYLIENNINDLIVIALTDSNLAYLCEREKFEHIIENRELWDKSTNPVMLLNIHESRGYSIVFKEHFLIKFNMQRPL